MMCVILHTSVITQDGDSALMEAAYRGRTDVVVELVKAGALLDLQNTVCPCDPIIHDVHVYTGTCILSCYILKLKVISLTIHVFVLIAVPYSSIRRHGY